MKKYKSLLACIVILVAFITPFLMDVNAEPTNPPVWQSYSEYMFEEAQKSLENPQLYVGYTAQFNVNCWDNFLFGNVVDGEIIYDEETNYFESTLFTTENGDGIKVVIEEFYIEEIENDEDSIKYIWYKIVPAEGYELPEEIKDLPYISHFDNLSQDVDVQGALQILPKKGMFIGETVTFSKENVVDTETISVSTNELPDFVDITYLMETNGQLFDEWEWYVFDNASSLHSDLTNDYCYVLDSSIYLIPAEVTYYYELLMRTTQAKDYYDIYNSISEDIINMFTEKHINYLQNHINSLVPTEIVEVYEKLINTTSVADYYRILEKLEQSTIDMLFNFYEDELTNHFDTMYERENVVLSNTVMYNGKQMNISVKGKIPNSEIAELVITPISYADVVNAGFDLTEEEIMTALDIKIINKSDSSQWQPQEGEYVAVTFDFTNLDYEDGTLAYVHHKHNDEIKVSDFFVVMQQQITYYTDGFSMFVVRESDIGKTTGYQVIQEVQDGQTLTLEVGQEVVLYCNMTVNGALPDAATWQVTDTSGAIHYTVHTGNVGMPGNTGVKAYWIKIKALKTTVTDTQVPANDTRVTLTYVGIDAANEAYEANARAQDDQTFKLVINTPTPKENEGDYKLYIKDLVNTTGKIQATLVDKNGNEVPDGFAGASFTWSRRDDKNGEYFITPIAYEDDNQSINIARDHGGLVEDRKRDDGTYAPTTYTVTVRLANGDELSASYVVYYQSEIINASFELPQANTSTYSFFTNGWPELYWETSAPGKSNKLTRDIEYGDVTNNTSGETKFGVIKAADHRPEDGNGVQFAEVNAEEFGALYQDIITFPGEEINWEFYHAPRPDGNTSGWDYNISNAMFIVMGATEDAQKLTTQGQLEALCKLAYNYDDINATPPSIGEVREVDYNGANYKVWYHDAGTVPTNLYGWADYNYNNTADIYEDAYAATYNNGWTELEGSYLVPPGQFRTRLFFVSQPSKNDASVNAGNLIDAAKAGQYKSFLVEYFEESFQTIDGQSRKVITHLDFDEKGDALLYSSIPLTRIDDMTSSTHDYLHKILVNGENYPYDVRFLGDESIYVESYPKTANLVYPTIYKDDTMTEVVPARNNYADYDLVIQVFVRDTVIAVQKDLNLPAALTPEQKLEIFEGLNAGKPGVDDDKDGTIDEEAEGGYIIDLDFDDMSGDDYHADSILKIRQVNPNGNYSGYIAPDLNPPLNDSYVVKEILSVTNINGHDELGYIPGLELSSVTFDVIRYRYGSGSEFESDENNTNFNRTKTYSKELGNLTSTTSLECAPFELSDQIVVNGVTERGYKIAEVNITNTYVEKKTTIHYKAIGNGKLKWVGGTEYVDYPTEELAFYSGVATGCEVHEGQGAVFMGWYKDEACTIPVEAIDGKYDTTTGSFKPNANIINADEVTFYAKFETKSIVINRTNGQPGQSYIYHVEGTEGDDTKFDTYVSLTCDENGNGSVEVIEVLNKNVKVTEIGEWTWRFEEATNPSITKDVTKQTKTVYDFSGPIRYRYWLNGFTQYKNTYGKEAVQP